MTDRDKEWIIELAKSSPVVAIVALACITSVCIVRIALGV